MVLRSLLLSQFRCFESLRLDLPPSVALIYGNNAQGKTSLLEAACVLLRLQSPRCSSLADCIHFSHDFFGIGGTLEASQTAALRLQYRGGDRKLSVDGETQRSASEYLRHSALVVWMANDDLHLVRGGGDQRRRFLDFMASQLFPGYREALRAYEKALRSRNFLLKRDSSPRWDQIDAYSRILHENGSRLTANRRTLIERLLPHAQIAQSRIAGSGENLDLEYQSASGEGDDLIATLTANRDEEMRRRQTSAGPHRDDLLLTLDGKPAAKYASEGQQRTVALALKLGQANLFLESRSDPPIILIDDIFGELDPQRRNALMAHWPVASQKLIATTHLDWLDRDFSGAVRLHVSAARVQQEE